MGIIRYGGCGFGMLACEGSWRCDIIPSFCHILLPHSSLLLPKHEEASVEMFDHMVEANGLKEEFERWGLNMCDITFVKEQIAGPLRLTQEEDQVRLPPA